MSAAAIIAIAVGVVVILAALSFVTLARKSDVRGAGALSGETRRRDRSAREAHPAEAVVEPAPTAREVEAQGEVARYGTTLGRPVRSPRSRGRRPTPRRSASAAASSSTGPRSRSPAPASGPSSRPVSSPSCGRRRRGGFGQPVTVGKIDDVKDGIREGHGFFYAPAARTWITAYPADALPAAAGVRRRSILAGMEQGLVALYQKCPHLGCRVPQCITSQWFECPCHGSQYNQVGEKKAGPAPRGMDRFPLTVAGNGDVTVDTGTIVPGPPIGTNTTGQEAEGPHCITGGGEH